jgi:hypothetical protein
MFQKDIFSCSGIWNLGPKFVCTFHLHPVWLFLQYIPEPPLWERQLLHFPVFIQQGAAVNGSHYCYRARGREAEAGKS